MNPTPLSARKQSGSVLVLMLVLAGLLVVTLGGYFWWVRSQNLLVARSQAWNAALGVAEAGIEEGLAQINVDFGTNYTASAHANWGAPEGGVFTLGPRTNASGFYTVQLLATNPGPVLISTGFVSGGVLSKPLMRTVQVTTAPVYAFSKAVTTSSNLNFNLKNVPAPNTAGWLTGLPSLTQGTYYLQAPYNYVVNGGLTIHKNNSLSVVGPGVVQLQVNGDFIMQGSPQTTLNIAPGATLVLYVGSAAGPPVTAALQNVVNGGVSSNFQYYGLPSNTNLTVTSSGSLTGLVYAPQASLAFTAGSTNGPINVQGAFVANSVVTNGLFIFYNDPSLGTNGPITGFSVTSWREL